MHQDQAKVKQSEAIDSLRFWLMLLVVFIHIPIGGEPIVSLDFATGKPLMLQLYDYLVKMVSFTLGYAGVPTFFLISGYYMFYRQKNWLDISIYTSELRKRLKTVLLPYIIWNSLIVLSWAIRANFFSKMGGGISPYGDSLEEALYNIYWGMPANFALWYLKELIILSLLAPIFYAMARYAPYLLVLPLLLMLAGEYILPISYSGLFCFSLGAVLGLRRVNIVEQAQRIKGVILPLLLCATLIMPLRSSNHPTLLGLYILLAIIGFLALAGEHYDRVSWVHRLGLDLSGSVFFVYVAHLIEILGLSRGAFIRMGWFETPLGYLACGLFVMGVCIAIHRVLSRLMPRLLSIMTGGR